MQPTARGPLRTTLALAALAALAAAALAGDRRASVAMRLARAYLRTQRGPTRGPAELRRAYVGRPYPAPAPPTRSLRSSCDVREARALGRTVYTVTPRLGATDRHIVYTHGGSFVHALVRPHWAIVEQLARATGATVSVPMYPLAPEHRHAEALYLLEHVYRDLLRRTTADRVVLCGDSAGGNLALTQALHYRDRSLPLPGAIVLFAPWLDLTLSDPAIAAVEPHDVMLRRAELVEFGRWWAGPEDPRDPLLSPLFADLRGLPPIQIHQGTADLFVVDARRLRARVAAAGGAVELHETAGGFHVFMGATFTPEARVAFRRVAAFL